MRRKLISGPQAMLFSKRTDKNEDCGPGLNSCAFYFVEGPEVVWYFPLSLAL